MSSFFLIIGIHVSSGSSRICSSSASVYGGEGISPILSFNLSVLPDGPLSHGKPLLMSRSCPRRHGARYALHGIMSRISARVKARGSSGRLIYLTEIQELYYSLQENNVGSCLPFVSKGLPTYSRILFWKPIPGRASCTLTEKRASKHDADSGGVEVALNGERSGGL